MEVGAGQCGERRPERGRRRTRRGKAGTVADYKLSKTGHATITVRQDSEVCFKTLAMNVEKRGKGGAG